MAMPKVERSHKKKDQTPSMAPDPQKSSISGPRVGGNTSVNRSNLAVKDRLDEARRASLGPGLEGILNISRQVGEGVVTGRAAEASRFMLGGLTNSIKEEANVLDEVGAAKGERGTGQHRSAIYVNSEAPWVESMDRALVALQEAVRSFPRNAQRTSVAKAHETLVESFGPLAKMGYRTVAGALLDLVVAKAAAVNLDRFTQAGDERQLFAARVMAVQQDAFLVVPERGKRIERRMEMPQVLGFAVPTGDGTRPVGVSFAGGVQSVVLTGTVVRQLADGSTEAIAKKTIPLSEFLQRYGIAYEAAEGDPRYIPQQVVEQLREKGVEAIARQPLDSDLLPEGINGHLVAAEFTSQGVTRQIAQIDGLIRSLEEAVATEARATCEEFDAVRPGQEESTVTLVARQQCGEEASDEVVEAMRTRIMQDFERNVKARLEVEFGLGGLRALSAYASYVTARRAFPNQVGESVYKHGFPRRLSTFLVAAGWEAGGRVDAKGDRIKPDARFQELDKIMNRAGQTYRSKFMQLDVIEREIAVQSEAMREMRAALAESRLGGFSEEALASVLGEDAIADYANSYKDEVATIREGFEGYRKAARKAMGDAFAGVMMSRRSAIPGLIDSDPASDDGFNEREERMDLVRERMDVTLGILEDRFLKRGRKKSDEVEKVDRAIQSFLKTDNKGVFSDRTLALAVNTPSKIEDERSPMLESLETFREVAEVVDTLEDSIGALRFEYEFANRLLRNAYPRDHKDDLMRPTSGAGTAVAPQTMNTIHPMDLIARSASGGYLVFPVRSPLTSGDYRVGAPTPVTRIDLAPIIDANNQANIRTIVYAWTSKKGDLSPEKAVEGIDGVALNNRSSRKLAWVTVEPGRLFEALGIQPASGFLPKIGQKLGASWNRSFRNENGRYETENFDRPHLPLTTSDHGSDRMVWFPLPEKPGQVDECMKVLTDWFDARAEDRIEGALAGTESYDRVKYDFERFRAEGLLRVRKSMEVYAGGARDFAWLAPSFGVSGGVNSPSILGFQAYKLPEKDAAERGFKVSYKHNGVEAIKEVLRGFGEAGCLVSPMIVTADPEKVEGVEGKGN